MNILALGPHGACQMQARTGKEAALMSLMQPCNDIGGRDTQPVQKGSMHQFAGKRHKRPLLQRSQAQQQSIEAERTGIWFFHHTFILHYTGITGTFNKTNFSYGPSPSYARRKRRSLRTILAIFCNVTTSVSPI